MIPRASLLRLVILSAAFAAFAVAAMRQAWAQEPPQGSRCMDLNEFNRKANAQGYPDSKTVTETQRAFLAGIFAMNPLTPPGLPKRKPRIALRRAMRDQKLT